MATFQIDTTKLPKKLNQALVENTVWGMACAIDELLYNSLVQSPDLKLPSTAHLLGKSMTTKAFLLQVKGVLEQTAWQQVLEKL